MGADRKGAIETLARRGGVVEVLRLPAALFALLSRLRGALYDRRVLSIRKLDTPVVSVGNLTAGGTGKTPMVAWLVAALREEGLRAGILSRGYGSRSGEANDEARLLARLCPDTPHVQNPDRVAGGMELERLGVDVIVLDDGFQHRRLARDLDLVLVDATRPWGLPARNGAPVRAFLPRGLLREETTSLRRAQMVVLTRVDGATAAELDELSAEFDRFGLPVGRATHRPSALRTPSGETDLSALKGIEVDLVSAIANPDAFEATVESLGARVVSHTAFRDHHQFTAEELSGLGSERPWIVTGKDATKLPEGTGAWVLDVAMEWVEGEDSLRELLRGLPTAQRRRERMTIHEGLHG